ncbi:MAG: effector binding domain-containing protein [Candidatus Hermodarchaeota archaeon]|nr:effector binding domain-containing protein [Candidatus Hermodarchaeota archaeon]
MNEMDTETAWNVIGKLGKDVAHVLSAIANEKRLQILTALLHRPRLFSELRELTGLGKTALSHHLGLLVREGVILQKSRGRYEVSPDGQIMLTAISSAYLETQHRQELHSVRTARWIERIYAERKEKEVEDLFVQVVELEPMRVASVKSFSATPEIDAWEKMRAWAEPQGLLEDLDNHPVFGFNNPNPSPGQKEYGYEFWMRMGTLFKGEGEIEAKDADGGLFAITSCRLGDELESEYTKEHRFLDPWKKLVEWVILSEKYEIDESRQCLEKTRNPGSPVAEVVLDLYQPIKEIKKAS